VPHALTGSYYTKVDFKLPSQLPSEPAHNPGSGATAQHQAEREIRPACVERRYTAAVPARRRSSPEAQAPRSAFATRFSWGLKRLIDVLVAAAGLVLLAPVLMAIAVVIQRDAGSPVMFRQVRAGQHGKPFTILKFRTMEMRDARCCLRPSACIGIQMAPGRQMPASMERLRRTGLDELPQLVNVLRGDMSFVGPRPLMLRYVPRYTKGHRRRLDVRPGITGWAQVNGRTDLPWDDKLDLDVWYVEHQSLALDLRIMAATVWTALTGRGYSQSGSETGLEFLGTGVAPGLCPATELPLEPNPPALRHQSPGSDSTGARYAGK
jgi:lipopolysaccharide/colanic/teichoic acid biosynthesis glycosyltransferase